jgi:hypothetical protein
MWRTITAPNWICEERISFAGCLHFPVQNHFFFPSDVSECKDKAIPVTGRGGLQVCEMLRIPHCLDNRLIDVGNAVSPRAGRSIFSRNIFNVISVIGWVNTRAIVRLEGLRTLKKNQWPHRYSKKRPSCLWHSATINYATACPNLEN